MIQRLIDRIWKAFYKDYMPPSVVAKNYLLKAAESKAFALVLNVGCGRDNFCEGLARSTLRIGLDLSDEIKQAKGLDYRVKGVVETMPFADETFDVIFTFGVIEHLQHPSFAFTEFARVLKPDGFLILGTPNIWNYTMVVSRLTPLWLHNCIRHYGSGAPENCLTYYKANSVRRLRRIAQRNGFQVVRVDRTGHAFTYFRLIGPLYAIALAGDILTNFKYGRFLRLWITVVARKLTIPN